MLMSTDNEIMITFNTNTSVWTISSKMNTVWGANNIFQIQFKSTNKAYLKQYMEYINTFRIQSVGTIIF